MQLRPLLLVLVAAGLACSVAGCSSSSTTDTPAQGSLDVTIESGPIHGAVDGAVRSFLGIPYAAPPVGPLRFMPPKPVAAWTAPREAVGFGAPCTQPSGTGISTSSSEDCLYLNVWLPARAVTKAKVLVWIHGGGFTGGSGSDSMYSGAALAEKAGVIVVTLNYRLGALGFLSHPALAKAQGVAISPSAGLLDQQAAIAWVHRNIAAFGGDPNSVLLAGESAGGVSVCAQLAMGGPKDHFAAAAIESGLCSSIPLIFGNKATADDMGTRLATAVGCANDDSAVTCLQGKTASEITLALPPRKAIFGPTGDVFVPVVDGVALPKAPIDAIRAGEARKVPTIVGANLNEGQIFLALWGGDGPTADDVRGSLKALFDPTKVEGVATRYAIDTDAKKGFVSILSDAIPCMARQTARALSGAGTPTWLYRFVYPYSIPAFPNVVTTHAFEIPFLFRTGFAGANLNDTQLEMADVLGSYWLSLGNGGDPNAHRLAGTPAWPTYSKAADELLMLDMPSKVDKGTSSEACDFWDGLLER